MDRCSACPRVNTCVPPSGPMVRGGVMFIGEAPGKDEDKLGIPFIGKTGDEVNGHYLPLAGLRRDNCYFTNAIKCWPVSNDGKLDMKSKADKEMLRVCATKHLYEEIAQMEPSLIVPMGAFACYAIDPNISLDIQHGIPFDTAIDIPSFPMWHPAGGMHEPKKMREIRTDWIRLGRYLRGTLKIYTDQYPDPDYKEIESEKELRAILDPTRPMANDTEYSRALGPFCLTFSQQEGTGRLIRADRKDLLGIFNDFLRIWESDIWFHNYPYDSAVVREMGLSYPKRVRDTMLRIFHLGNLPQGLKAIAYRELGMQMMDFEDLVHPYSKLRVLEYFSRGYLEHDWPKPDESMRQDPKTGQWKLYKPQSMKTKLKRFLGDVGRNPDKEIFKAWDNWEDHRAEIEAKLGPYPGVDIAHAAEDNWEAVLDYACRDSDATLRLIPIIEAMVEMVPTMKPQELWRAA